MQPSKAMKQFTEELAERQSKPMGNHTYSHPYYHSVSFEFFSRDILAVEPLIKDLGHFRKLFGFPYLKAGDTLPKREHP